MSYRLTQSEFRAKHLASYDAEAVEQYEAWTQQIGEADELAVLADIAQVFEFTAGLSILDVGAGTGAMCRTLMRIGGLELTALEPSSLMLAKLVSKSELSSVRTCQGFCDSREDQSLFPPEYFDVIVSRQLANGLYDPLAGMANWRHWQSIEQPGLRQEDFLGTHWFGRSVSPSPAGLGGETSAPTSRLATCAVAASSFFLWRYALHDSLCMALPRSVQRYRRLASRLAC